MFCQVVKKAKLLYLYAVKGSEEHLHYASASKSYYHWKINVIVQIDKYDNILGRSIHI